MSADSVGGCSKYFFFLLLENVLIQYFLNSAQSIWSLHISCTAIQSKYFIAGIRHIVVPFLHYFKSTPIVSESCHNHL